jgi:MoaA/NifB/PqqE/SkfB family radical SAM enzyme/Flp pilus assembly protein TadD
MAENTAVETAKSFINEGKYTEALEILRHIVEVSPSDKYAHFELGKIFLIQGNDALAEQEYRKVVELDGNFHEAMLELARIYARQGRREMSLEQYGRIIAKVPQRIDAYKELGKLCEDMGSPDKALESLKTAAALCPDNHDVLFEYARSLREAGREKEAAGVFEKVLQFDAVKNDTFLHNKVLNELEIAQRKEVLESKLRAMIAMIVDRCNIKCRICGIWGGKWQVRDSVLREIVDLFPYMEDICWQGGEVFMMKGFDDILEEGTRHRNLRQVIFTNGLMINEKILSKLHKGKVDLVFSIDAVDKETYEYIRYGATYERLIKVLELVREFRKSTGSNMRTYFNPVVMRSNYRQVEDFIEFGKKYEFNAVTFAPIRGSWGNENIFDAKDEEALSYLGKAIPRAEKKAGEYGMRLNNWLPVKCECGAAEPGKDGPSAGTVPEKKTTDGGRPTNRMICYAPWQRLLIDCEGPVRPFGFCPGQYVGNTDTMSLAEIWNGEGMRSYRRRIANNDFKDLCQPECISGQVRDKICKIE